MKNYDCKSSDYFQDSKTMANSFKFKADRSRTFAPSGFSLLERKNSFPSLFPINSLSFSYFPPCDTQMPHARVTHSFVASTNSLGFTNEEYARMKNPNP